MEGAIKTSLYLIETLSAKRFARLDSDFDPHLPFKACKNIRWWRMWRSSRTEASDAGGVTYVCF